MEQITLVFLIGAFLLFLLQMRFKNEYPLKVMGFFSSASVVALSLTDSELALYPEGLTIMLVTGFALTLYSIVGMLRKV